MDKEVEAIEAEKEAAQQKPLILTYEVTNPLIDGKNMMQLHDIVNCDFVVSRLQDKDGNIFIPNSQTVVHKGDKLYTVLSANDEERFKSVIGPELDIDWESNPGLWYRAEYLLPRLNTMALRSVLSNCAMATASMPHVSIVPVLTCLHLPISVCRWATVSRW